MIEITDILNNWRRHLSKDCKHGCNEGGCKNPHHCLRMKTAQVWSYRDILIPHEYRNYTIDNFDGMKEGKRLLKPSVVGNAKTALINYCWSGIEPGEEYSLEKWLPRNCMSKRKQFGTNVIIYGNSWTNDNTDGKTRVFKKQIGKTMLASIVLKEAINLRLLDGNTHLSDRYGWVNYYSLATMLMDKAHGNKSFEDDIWQYENADWLVLDGFEMKKDAGVSFRSNVLDQFFTARLQGNCPNILVFQDDISKFNSDEIREHFGIHISNIINSSKTHHIALLD